MGHLRKAAKHTAQYFAGRATVIALGLVTFPLFTRLLSVEQYGSLNLVSSLIFVAVAVSKMGMQQAVVRFHRENAGDPEAMRRCYSTLFFGNALIALATMGVYLGIVMLVPAATLGHELKLLLLAASSLVLVRAAYSMVLNLFQAEGKSIALSSFEVLLRCLSLLVIALLLIYWQPTAYAYLVGTVGVEAALLLAVLPYLLRRRLLSPGAFDVRFFRIAFSFGMPLMWAELGAYVLDSGDRVLVRYYLGPTALGFYTASYGVASYVRDLLVTPVSLAIGPICMDVWNKQGAEQTSEFISKSLRHYGMIVLGVLCALVLCSRDLLVILASKKYEPAHALLPVLMAGLVIASFQLFLRTGLFLYRRPAVIARSTFVAIIVNVVLNVVLLPKVGVMGAAIATLISYAVQLLLIARASLILLPVTIDYRAAVKYMVAAAIVITLGWQIHADNRWLEILARGSVSTLYFGLVWLLDTQSRRAVRTAVAAAASRIVWLGR